MFAAAGQTMRNVIADYFRHAQVFQEKITSIGGRCIFGTDHRTTGRRMCAQPFQNLNRCTKLWKSWKHRHPAKRR